MSLRALLAEPGHGLGPGRGIRLPCGWHRIWRITRDEEVFWDRAARFCHADLLPAEPSARPEESTSGLAALTAAVVARVVLCCDIGTLLRLAAAWPAVGRGGTCCAGPTAGSQELAEALPGSERGAGGGASRVGSWLSFARASLRWAEVCSLIETFGRPGRQFGAGGAGSGTRRLHEAQLPLYSAAALSRGSIAEVVLPSAATCAAVCLNAPDLLAVGEGEAVRMWHSRTLERLGMVTTRGVVFDVDINHGGSLLAAASSKGPPHTAGDRRVGQEHRQSVLAVWDLGTSQSRQSLLWQEVMPLIAGIAFCTEGMLAVVSAHAAVALLASSGARLAMLPFGEGGSEPVYCCRHTRCTPLVVGRGRGFWRLASCSSSDTAFADPFALVALDEPSLAPDDAVVAMHASQDFCAAATRGGLVLVWSADTSHLLASINVGAAGTEGLAWAVDRVAVAQIASVFCLDEAVICSLAVGHERGGVQAVGAWHVPSGTRLPLPWHQDSPLGRSDGSQQPVAFVTGNSVMLKFFSVDANVRWLLATGCIEGRVISVLRVARPPTRS